MACSLFSFLAVACSLVAADAVVLKQRGAAAGNSIAEVIKLMQGLKKEIMDDGAARAKLYAVEAKSCKTDNDKYVKAIVADKTKIEEVSAELVDDDAEDQRKLTKLSERKENQETLAASLKAEVLSHAKAAAEYQASSADNAKGIASLTKAINTMKTKFGAIGKVALVQVSLNDLFDGAAPPKVSAVAKDPAYKYHSNEIMSLLQETLKTFQSDKEDADAAWKKTNAASAAEQKSIAGKMKTNMDAMTKLGEQDQVLKGEISTDKGDLVKVQSKDVSDVSLLKATTKSCEAAATEYDRKAALQNQVATALTKVLGFLGDTSKAADAADASAGTAIDDVNPEANTRIKAIDEAKKARREAVGLSFFQAPVTSFLSKGRTVLTALEQAKMESVVSLLRDTSNKLSSPQLAMLVMNIGGVNHFKKVESMIHNLIKTLLEENQREISKNGFCETETNKANKARSIAKDKADSLNADLTKLESLKEKLEVDLSDTKKEIENDNTLLNKLIKMREATKARNMETIKKAKEGITALGKAKAVYKEAAGVQDKVAEESTPQAGTAEERMGTGAKAITALLQTITTDMNNQVSETEADDKENQANFVESSTAIKENIKAQETEFKMDTMDLTSTKDKISKALDDLDMQMGLMKDALAMVANLKPACLDAGGMSFSTRKTKRDEEVAALNSAIKALKA